MGTNITAIERTRQGSDGHRAPRTCDTNQRDTPKCGASPNGRGGGRGNQTKTLEPEGLGPADGGCAALRRTSSSRNRAEGASRGDGAEGPNGQTSLMSGAHDEEDCPAPQTCGA